MNQNNNIKVTAVTVTYNSADTLYKTVDALLSQTYNVSNIVIVDNASNEENKLIINTIKSKSDIITVITLDENTGGAGGFETGMRYVDKNIDYDYIWLMDDDAYPTETCIENLLKYIDLENIGCLCPLIYGIDNKEYQLYHHKNLRRFLTKDEMAYKTYDEVPEVGRVEANAFVGPLIPKNVINDIGFPDGKLFIYGDDTEYTYRISRKYSCYLIKSAVINHRDINASISINPNSLWKDYYMYRNRLWLENDNYKSKIILNFISNFITLLGIIKRKIVVVRQLSSNEFRIQYFQKIRSAANDGVNTNFTFALGMLIRFI